MSGNTGERGVIRRAMDKVQDLLGELARRVCASAVPSADAFVDRIAVHDMYALVAARLALRRSSSPEVQAFAARELAEHTTSIHHLQAALEMNETRGVAPPPDKLSPRFKKLLVQLQAAPDDDFDAAYLDQQIAVHEEMVALLAGYRDQGDNAQLRAYAAAISPVFERHLRYLKERRAQ